MPPASRHQCLIYEGSPSRQLPALTEIVRQKLAQNYRCLYLNSPPMVAGMRSYLAAAGVDVARESARTSLMLSSDLHHLTGGSRFDVAAMMRALSESLELALKGGFAGLWATGDMTWEFGPEKDFSRLLEYEWQLEEFICNHPQMGGICQYHADTIPQEALRQGVRTHSSLFVNQTLSMINPHFLHPQRFVDHAHEDAQIASFIDHLCRPSQTA